MSLLVRKPKLAQKAANRIGVRLNAPCIIKGGGAFGHLDVSALRNDFGKKRLMGGAFAFPAGATLRCGASTSGLVDRKAPPRALRA